LIKEKAVVAVTGTTAFVIWMMAWSRKNERVHLSCLMSLDKYRAAIYLVWAVLINTRRIFILFDES